MTCGRKIGPYSCCTVVEGDCLELMKALPDGCVDAVITDPPYGLASWSSTGGNSITATQADEINKWDAQAVPDAALLRCKRLAPVSIIWGGNYFGSLWPCRAPLIWDKAQRGMHFADGELAWTSFDWGTLRILNYPILSGDTKGSKVHPTQKPIEVMAWCIEQAGMPETILDPFLGSGTTAVAAKKLGRHFLGFEISAEYCRIARERIALVEAQGQLFTPQAEQLTLGGNAAGGGS